MLSLIKQFKNNQYYIQGFNAVPIFIIFSAYSGLIMSNFNMKKLIERINQNKYYIQGANAVPVYLSNTCYDALKIPEKLGYGYSEFIYNFRNDYCEMSYNISDLETIRKVIQEKLSVDENYLVQIKSIYEANWQAREKFLSSLATMDLEKISNDKVVSIFKQCAKAQEEACGMAHLIEGASWRLDEEVKNLLTKELGQTTAGQYLSILLYPSQPSFLGMEEIALQAIKPLAGEERDEAIIKHLKKYFWVFNSYLGPGEMTVKLINERLAILSELDPRENKGINKKELMNKLGLSDESRRMIQLIDFLTIWQDERKANILWSISYFDRVIGEISRRSKIRKEDLCYLSVGDMPALNQLVDFNNFSKELTVRREGCVFWQRLNDEKIFTGKEYEEYLQAIKPEKNLIKEAGSTIHGIAASGGWATGRVVIVKSMEALSLVKKGDIIVASMTRPEFMPALRLAAGVVTDEGGITCHAAIISRELGIPCIIGTKIATQILHNGDLVELKANHGIVNILERRRAIN